MKKKLLAALIGVGLSMGSMGTSVASGTCDKACFERCDAQLTLCLWTLNGSKPYCFGQFNSCYFGD